MILNLIDSQSHFRLQVQDATNKIFELCRYMRSKSQVSLLDSVISTSMIIRFKRWCSVDKLISKNADAPHIYFFPVFLFLHHLRGQVIKRTA